MSRAKKPSNRNATPKYIRWYNAHVAGLAELLKVGERPGKPSGQDLVDLVTTFYKLPARHRRVVARKMDEITSSELGTRLLKWVESPRG